MKSKPALFCCLIVIAAAATAFRLCRLDLRPMHNDEANQAVRCGILLETGVYRYDATEHHGPSLYYISLPVLRPATGGSFAAATEFSLRIVPAAFGIALVFLPLLLACFIGRQAALWSAAFTAVAPAMVYYNRFYIHETLLGFFTFGAIAAAWRYLGRGRLIAAVAAGLCLGLMHATKETCVIAYAAMAGAGLACLCRKNAFFNPSECAAPDAGACGARLRLQPTRRLLAHFLAALAVGVAASVTLFSSLFTHWRGVADSVLTYFHYLNKAFAPGPHNHPFLFYLGMLTRFRHADGPLWTEGLIVALAAVGAGRGIYAGLKKQGPAAAFGLFIAVYTILMALIYSLLPYKTPWTMLSFYHGMILLAGMAAADIVQGCRRPWLKAAAAAALASGALHLAWQSYRASFRYEADPRNPYVYSQTSTRFLKLVRRIEELAAVHPKNLEMPVAVVTNPYDAWPLPWYLRKFGAVGYWLEPGEIPADLDPAVIVASFDKTDALEAALPLAGFCKEFHTLRPGALLALYIRPELWEAFLEARSASAAP